MRETSVSDGAASFPVTVSEPAEPANPARQVLFAVGRGGDPRRHAPLLAALAECGCAVIAPHFELLRSTSPSEDDLTLRARRLRLALDAFARPDVATVGVGHSIGATMLLALAGAQAWLGAGRPLAVAPDARLRRLVLLAPTTGFFQAPGALDAVTTPLLIWAGGKDQVTPPSHGEHLVHALGSRVAVELRVEAGAGHFSFMHVPPPQTIEPLEDRDAFLAQVTAATCAFVVQQG